MILWLISVWFTGSGVALGQWGLGGLRNPAAYATGTAQISTGVEGDRIWAEASLLGQGAGFLYDTLTRKFTWWLPAALGWEGGAVGYRYVRTPSVSRHEVGVLLRPRAWVSFGGVAGYGRGRLDTLQLGVGFRPVSWGIAFVDAVHRYGVDSVRFRYGLSLRPWPGLWVGGVREGDRVVGGLALSLGKGVFQAVVGKDSLRLGLSFLFPSVPSVWRPARPAVWTVEQGVGEIPSKPLLGRAKPSFTELLLRLEAVGRDPRTPALLVKLRTFPWGYAQAEELRTMLEHLRRRGKKVWVYAEGLNVRSLFFASAADRVFLHPEGMVVAPGIYAERFFLRGALEKLDVEVEADRIGKYKSAVELLTRSSMSPEDSLQHAEFLKDVWDVVVTAVAEGRRQDRTELEALLLSRGVFTAQEALAAGLVDGVRYEDQVDSLFRRTFGPGRPFVLTPEAQRDVWRDDRPIVAVVVAEGDIVVGKSSPPSPLPLPFFSSRAVGSWSQKALWEKLRKDRRVKAVVFRINSPGGSSQASEDIWREVIRTARVKPVVVSMGNIAASGGYYIAMGAGKVLADATTLTGSIGILWVKPVVAGLFRKLGITRDVVKIGEHADALSPFRGYTEEERAVVHRILEEGYRTFLRRVAEGRKMSVDAVHTLAQGRIWSGKSAREVGLVDEIGGVVQAVQEAARLAGLSAYRVRVFPVDRPSLFPGSGLEGRARLFAEGVLYRAVVDGVKP